MTDDTPIKNVSDTAFWVAYYRVKESERSDALFQDRFAKKLVGDRGKKIADAMPEISCYTEWSVIARTVIIDRFIEQLVEEGVDAVINLGAGLDTRPYRMKLPQNLEWIEVDYANIITHKNQTLKSETPNCQLTRVVVDLSNSQGRKSFLLSAAPQAKKVLILTEGVIPYLSLQQVTDLANDLCAESRLTYWITEYFHPMVYRYLKDTVRQAKMKNSPFQFYPADWFGFFKQLGWVEKKIDYTSEIALEFNRKPPMPNWTALLMPFFPKFLKNSFKRMSGYVILKRS